MNYSIVICYFELVALVYLTCVLMGAPILTDLLRTLGFSIYLVSIGFLPMIMKTNGNIRQIFDKNLFSSLNSLERNLIYGTMIGAWLGAIPIPLDWDRWWQRWPITCFVSSTFGAGLALIISYFNLLREKTK